MMQKKGFGCSVGQPVCAHQNACCQACHSCLLNLAPQSLCDAGGCLRGISPCANDPSRVAVSLDDNVVRLVSLMQYLKACT